MQRACILWFQTDKADWISKSWGSIKLGHNWMFSQKPEVLTLASRASTLFQVTTWHMRAKGKLLTRRLQLLLWCQQQVKPFIFSASFYVSISRTVGQNLCADTKNKITCECKSWEESSCVKEVPACKQEQRQSKYSGTRKSTQTTTSINLCTGSYATTVS